MAPPASKRTSEPVLIRKEMAKSRETLERDINVLKSRVLGRFTQTKEGIMAKKKSRSATAKTKKRSSKARTASRKSNPTMKRAKNVMGEMLTNAAIGAARGAAETVLEKTDGTNKNKKVRGR